MCNNVDLLRLVARSLVNRIEHTAMGTSFCKSVHYINDKGNNSENINIITFYEHQMRIDIYIININLLNQLQRNITEKEFNEICINCYLIF